MNRNTRIGILAAVIVGSFYAWRNRERIAQTSRDRFNQLRKNLSQGFRRQGKAITIHTGSVAASSKQAA